MLLLSRIYFALRPWHFGDFRNILLPNIGENRKKSYDFSLGPLGLQLEAPRTPPLVLIKKNTKCILVSIVSESQKGNKNWSLTKFWQKMLSKYEKGCFWQPVVGASVISCTFVQAGV